ncbi:glyoxalase superfamily protein [Naasia lichenicola]|nr:glyoxalase superfamily protein [Naasia lichenicola]
MMLLGPVIPILRIFDVPKADEFYLGFLGFQVDWEHTYSSGGPTYRQISRSGAFLHLTEHFGDGTPGTATQITVTGIAEFWKELHQKEYRHARPGLERQPWGRTVDVSDPFGNQLRFLEPNPE